MGKPANADKTANAQKTVKPANANRDARKKIKTVNQE